jgi:hypothetical protein
MTKRNDSKILEGYQEFLNGATDDDLIGKGLTAAEIQFVREFHAKARSGALLSTIVLGYPPKSRARKLSREMFHVYEHPKPTPRTRAAIDREISFVCEVGFEEYKMRGCGV